MIQAKSIHPNDSFTVASFNLRIDSRADHYNRWEYRKQLAMEVIRRSGACVIGVQEALPQMRQDLQEMLQGYSMFGWGRSKTRQSEHSDIIIRNKDADVVFHKTIWLSKHPEIPGSRAYFAVFPRICTVAEIYLKGAENQRVRVFNTHFDHVCGLARTLGVEIILRYIHEYNQTDPLPAIIMGDFNARPHSKCVRMLRENTHGYPDLKFVDVYSHFDKQDQSPMNTYHGFKGKLGKNPIDYIFVTDDIEIEDVKIDTSMIDGRYPSDHYPVIATLSLKNSGKQHVKTA
ncbi:endonuclease/exonuclease/phosphatase family protein [Zongyangia hominis]|uniref:Endonuclease/exonuclease/phosphatase family protein n=1 Tax=Zongyangia hominis TaxID=2763677 RepID=A0A926EBW1_9FIRM|nr:endonuclease/exonuclease/phosphatase family protein [Zongyangia hominis]MBC8569271.1 endonuclease/exonuclease/phosphatase family protein [Zongyangia hominis]